MKLYDIEKGSRIKTQLNDGTDTFIVFHHLDGMYSYCTLEGKPDAVVHLKAITPLKKVDHYYVIEKEVAPNYKEGKGLDNNK